MSTSGVCFARSPKSKTGPDKAAMIFSDTSLCDELQEDMFGFQFPEL
jgi:hypothetical protein